jgi:hypothetical protein
VLAEFLRTDHRHLQPLVPNSEAAQELKLLTRDYVEVEDAAGHKSNALKGVTFVDVPLPWVKMPSCE